jgi:hypothetical protein
VQCFLQLSQHRIRFQTLVKVPRHTGDTQPVIGALSLCRCLVRSLRLMTDGRSLCRSCSKEEYAAGFGPPFVGAGSARRGHTTFLHQPRAAALFGARTRARAAARRTPRRRLSPISELSVPSGDAVHYSSSLLSTTTSVFLCKVSFLIFYKLCLTVQF